MTDLSLTRTVICPACKGPSRYAADNPYRPFCSGRCRNVDLGAWASEQFRVGVEQTGDDPDELPGDTQAPH